MTPVLIAPRPEDISAIGAIHRAVDVQLLGAESTTDDEVSDDLARLVSPDHARVALVNGRVLGFARRWATGESNLVAHPSLPPQPRAVVLLALAQWLAQFGAGTEVCVPTKDEMRSGILAAEGWVHGPTSYDLFVKHEQFRPEPTPPGRLSIREADLPRELTVLHGVAQDAFGPVPGQRLRELAEWAEVFVDYPGRRPELQLVAEAGGEVVGIAMTRIWDDGVGWVSQLCVRQDMQRLGVGRALLLTAMARHAAAGCPETGLDTLAANEAALDLYTGVGMSVREAWVTWERQ